MQAVNANEVCLLGADDSATVQNAIAEAVRRGVRRVVIPRYNLRTKSMLWRIVRAIRIPEDFTLLLDNCTLVQETGVYDHMFCNSRADEPGTLENEQCNISILGVGNVCLSGGVHNRLMEKTSGRYGMPSVWCNTMFFWYNVRNLRVENLHIEHQRWWAMTHLYCREVTLRNIDFGAVPHVPNMDGIDLRLGCRDFTIENITGRTGDDVIAMTALKGGFEEAHAVEGKSPDICHVRIRNVMGDPFLHFVVRILNHDGCKIHDIELDTVYDVSDPTTKKRPKCTLGIGSNMYSKYGKAQPGDTCRITARHLTSRGEKAIRIDNTCRDAHFSDVKTFGDNLTLLGRLDGPLELQNVVLEDVFYGRHQQEMFCSTALSAENYTGTVFDLPRTTGQITVKNIHIHKAHTVMQADSPLLVVVENCQIGCALEVARNTGGAKWEER